MYENGSLLLKLKSNIGHMVCFQVLKLALGLTHLPEFIKHNPRSTTCRICAQLSPHSCAEVFCSALACSLISSSHLYQVPSALNTLVNSN